MAGLCGMAVMLAFSMSVGNSLPVDVTWVQNHAHILDKIRMENVQVCLAVNFPEDDKKLEEEMKETRKVITGYGGGAVYKGTNVVAAMRKENTSPSGKTYTDHAEARVLDNIQPLAINSKDHILVLYSYLSPCGQKCTNQNHNYNILGKIDDAIQKANWTDHAFVFTKVFDGYGRTQFSVDDIKETFNSLKGTKIGQNIFRCYFSHKGTRCIKCFNNGVLSDECVHN